MIRYLLYVLIILIIYKCITVKEGFSGFHEVNTIVRFMRRCNDAIGLFKDGVWVTMDTIMAKKSGDKCKHHYECKDKCLCNSPNNSTKKDTTKLCTCIPIL